MGLDDLRQEQGLEVASMEEHVHLSRLRELAIMAMEAVEDDEGVKFSTMGEVMKALELYARERRLVAGEPTERRETNINISLGGKGKTPIKAVEALLAIAAVVVAPEDSPLIDEDVIDITPLDD